MPKTAIQSDDLQKLSNNVAEELCWYVKASEGRFDSAFERSTRPIVRRMGLDYEKYEKILKEKSPSVLSLKDIIVADIVNGNSELYTVENAKEVK